MGFYKPSHPAKTLAPLAILLLVAFSAWRLHHTHSSVAHKLAQLDRPTTAAALCPPCAAQDPAVAAAAAAAGGLLCTAANTGGINGSSSIDQLVGGAPQAAAGLGPEADSSRESGTGGVRGAHLGSNIPDTDRRDWVFSGDVGPEEAAAPANAILDTEASQRNLSAACKAWGGFQVVRNLQQGAQPLCSGASSVKVYSANLPNREQPFQMALVQNASFAISVGCSPNGHFLKDRSAKLTGPQYVSTRLFQSIQLNEPQQVCTNPRIVLPQNTPDIRWFVNPASAYGCYRSIVFMRNAESGSPILKNTAHPFASCFSPVVTALVAYIKASVNLPSIAPPATPMVCWMSRDENVRPEYTAWQKARTIQNQAGLVSELDKLAITRGARVMQLAFYGNHSSVSISEQLHRAARCSLITGMHGAGLYAAVAMKAPAILEFTTQRIPNRNAYNLMSHIGGCYQGMEIVTKDKVHGTLDPLQVWPKVLQALEKCGVIAPIAATQQQQSTSR
ncbi:hypothetical protein DUNSADRAFT_16004 [Dunaliella salina]|uniref:Glycosyltransferase 61 catalytic domain-containing protein n=1 Tax=Dunaliella salina TaxID=3046 RepID=A0ABQ7G4E8_DUNSA|nr:hypothetical protein DUNSADRAFT_16004 [Dunaliella salina]|eukprot:KAF5829481.1 hypothetical protein DUNSADRAFT_16004 [Dunaliella salina]